MINLVLFLVFKMRRNERGKKCFGSIMLVTRVFKIGNTVAKQLRNAALSTHPTCKPCTQNNVKNE